MANTKVSDLDEMTVPLSTDELLVIDDPGGTPASQRVSLSNLLLATSDIIPAAKVTHNADQSIADTTWTSLEFNTEVFDTDTIHDTVTNNERLTCKTAGKYLIIAQGTFGYDADGYRLITIYLNGTTDSIAQASNVGLTTAWRGFISIIYDLAVNDYVICRVFHNAGNSINIGDSGLYSPYFQMVRIGD